MMLYFYANKKRLQGKSFATPQKTTLSPFWKIMPYCIVKWIATRNCPQKRINNTMYVEAFPRTFISIGKAK